MKERIVIAKDKIKVLTSGGRFPANGYFTFNKDDAKVDKYPTNWEELKELCEDLKIKVENLIVEFLPPKTHYDCEVIWFRQYGLWVDSNGFVLFKKYIDEDMIGGAKHRTPAQMWNIIKNLIGD